MNFHLAPLVLWEQLDEIIDSDCACPDKAFRLEHEAQSNAAFRKVDGAHAHSLPNSFHLAYSPFAPGGPCVLNQSAWKVWQSFAAPQPLINPVDHLLAEQHLIHPQENPPRPVPQQPETLTVWLHVSNACNLDCFSASVELTL